MVGDGQMVIAAGSVAKLTVYFEKKGGERPKTRRGKEETKLTRPVSADIRGGARDDVRPESPKQLRSLIPGDGS